LLHRSLFVLLVGLFSAVPMPPGASAAIREFPMPGAGPAIISGPDGALWFTKAPFIGSGAIWRITPTGKSTQLLSASNTSYPSITSGPDGAVWFVRYISYAVPAPIPSTGTIVKIGRLTTSGSVSEFSPGPFGARAITAGSDGALWFTTTVQQSSAIGRITTAGSLESFPVPLPPGQADHITGGPDSALWFLYGNMIGRITTRGSASTYRIPAPLAGSSPLEATRDITAGPDGALWFTEEDVRGECAGSRIGRITTAGAVKEFRIPTPNSCPRSIITGPDGALWFTEFDGDKIGRITTAGRVSEFQIRRIRHPLGIAVGRDGALWFTAEDKIVRFTIPRRERCSRLKGRALKRCRVIQRHKKALARCRRISNRKRRAACIRSADRTYHRALARAR
jgi:virginiamycin B lyase